MEGQTSQNQTTGFSNSMAEGAANVQRTASVTEQKNYDNNFAADFNLSPKVLQTKFISLIAGGILLFGMFFGCAMAPKSAPKQTGLGDIVLNPYVQNHPVPRCGQVDVNRACVLYVMNAKPQDRLGRDFFEDAANITGVAKYTIQINNVAYSEKLIRPGFITQIYIPARR